MDNFFKHSLEIKEKQTLVKITKYVRQDVIASKIKNGIVVVYCAHTTAGITINENADPDVITDIIYGYEKIIPSKDPKYKHFEGNTHAHIKSSAVGASQTLIINEGSIILGVWQDIYLCEFDGPKKRTFYVKVIEG